MPIIQNLMRFWMLHPTRGLCMSQQWETDIQPGHRGRGSGSVEKLGEANFQLCINQTGMWVQLIALGRHPTSRPFFFPRAGPALCSGDEQLDSHYPSVSWVGRIHMSRVNRIIDSLSCDFLCTLMSVWHPQISFTNLQENVWFSAAVDTLANLPTSLNVSHHSRCWNNVSTFSCSEHYSVWKHCFLPSL